MAYAVGLAGRQGGLATAERIDLVMTAFVVLEIPALIFGAWGRRRVGFLAWAPAALLVLLLIAALLITGG